MDAYLLSKVELLDFGCTALTYENAGGFFGGMHSQKLNLTDLLKKGKKGIDVEGFMLLTPDKEYHEAIIKYIKS